MNGEATDAEIFEASHEDPRLFGPIFERHFDAVRRYLVRRTGPEVGRDLAADTFVEALHHRERFDPSRGSARPWLMGIATNLVRHHFRAEQYQLAAYRREASMAASAHEADVAEEAAAFRLSPALVDAVGALEPRDRDVLLLYAWGELEYSEIADALALPIGTVRSRLHRCRTRVRELLGPDEAITDESVARLTGEADTWTS